MYELDDAYEPLGDLIDAMQRDHSYDEARLRVDLGHVMAHLNRSWAMRNLARDVTEE